MRVTVVLLLVACFQLFPEDVTSLLSNVRLVDLLERPVRAVAAGNPTNFKYKWLASDGNTYDVSGPGRLEIAATPAITEKEHEKGTYIVKLMTRNMPSEVWDKLMASKASVGLFTKDDKTTVYPEYAKYKDRPECKGTCSGACSDTCYSIDGRKYDDLAGVGGIRATCVNDNFMCYADDPYTRQFNVLVHEFAHTVHSHGLPDASKYFDKIRKAFENANTKKIWDLKSYAMSNELEYFGVATGVFFNADRHATSTGGMNSCGHKDKMCADETEARDWLAKKDPLLFDALSFVWTNNRPTLPGSLAACVA